MAMHESRFVRMEFVALEQSVQAVMKAKYQDLAGRLSPDQYQYECGMLAGLNMALDLCADIEKGND